jgi:putative Mg2+ transporter-C (MgtC) family protein
MDITSFCLHAAAAGLMGAAIGLERQWHLLHTVGLRTNALVAFGADLFVSLPGLLGGSPGPAHLAGQVATGVGFLGGGVILREGLNVKGMNTAATLWCSAAVGAMTGAGLPLAGLAGTLGVLAIHLALRPVSDWIDHRLRTALNAATAYRLRVSCQVGGEGTVRSLLLKFFHDHPTMIVQGVTTQAGELGAVHVSADIHSEQRDDRTLEELMTLVNDEPRVSSVSWEKEPSAYVGRTEG